LVSLLALAFSAICAGFAALFGNKTYGYYFFTFLSWSGGGLFFALANSLFARGREVALQIEGQERVAPPETSAEDSNNAATTSSNTQPA